MVAGSLLGGVVEVGRADRVVAAAPYFNEADVVAIRLRELAGVVDAHCFVEAGWTYAGSANHSCACLTSASE
jgi:hypothetical protein